MYIDFNRLTDTLKRHEGFRGKPYLDSVGKTTIGYGWNLDEGISENTASEILHGQVTNCMMELLNIQAFIDVKSRLRREVLINMCFNLGLTKLLKFEKMWAAIMARAWNDAADEMMDSLWAKQVGSRADELSEMMKIG